MTKNEKIPQLRTHSDHKRYHASWWIQGIRKTSITILWAYCEITGDKGVRRGEETTVLCVSYGHQRDDRLIGSRPSKGRFSTRRCSPCRPQEWPMANLGTSRKSSPAYSLFKCRPQLITDAYTEVVHYTALESTYTERGDELSLSHFRLGYSFGNLDKVSMNKPGLPRSHLGEEWLLPFRGSTSLIFVVIWSLRFRESIIILFIFQAVIISRIIIFSWKYKRPL